MLDPGAKPVHLEVSGRPRAMGADTSGRTEMTRITRRDGIKLGAGALAGAALWRPGGLRAEVMAADVQPPKYAIEDGA
jgi:hypothetical protein